MEKYLLKSLFDRFLVSRILFLMLFIIILGGAYQSFGQASYNASLACQTANATPNALTKSTVNYANTTARPVSGGANSVLTESWKVKADVNGQLGFFHGFQVNYNTLTGGACLDQTSNSRQFALYSYTGNVCSGTSITPFAVNDGITKVQTGGAETNTMNPSWTGLTPNGDYVVIVKTTIGAACIGILNTYGAYYGNVAQVPPVTLCGQTVYQTGSAGFATGALAVANNGATGATNYRFLPNTTFKQIATVKADPNGTLGVINYLTVEAPDATLLATCSANTRATRTGTEQLFLKDPITGGCTGSAIPKMKNGTNSSTFNPEWVGLLPNTDYVIIFTTTVDPVCTDYISSTVSYYGAVTPQFTFNCSVSSSTGTFIKGTGSSGTLTVGITGATAGAATFNVSGTGFTGTLTTTLTAGQTSVTIPITYDGIAALGPHTLTVTSASGGGTCSKDVLVDLDTDGDGIGNAIDLDDDNDGILDTVENTCSSVTVSKTGVTASMTLTAGLGTVSNLLNGTEANDFWYTNAQAIATKTIATFNFPSAVNLTGIEITTSGVSFLNTGATVKVQGWDGTAWVDVSSTFTPTAPTASTYSSFNSVKFDFASNITTYTKYQILGVSGTTNSSPWVYEAYFSSPCTIAMNDADGDGIINSLDLDSDGDGCSDALEGGSTNSLAPNYKFTTAVGTNGLANSLETVVDNGIINYTLTYDYALSASFKACTDYDGDGVPDVKDLDDDNDGILDIVENKCINPYSATTFPTTTGVGSIDWQNIGATLTATGGTFQNNLLGTVTITGTSGSQIAIGTANNSGTYLEFANQAHTMTISWTNPVTSMILPLADMDFNEEVTLAATGATFTPLLLGPTDYWTAPNILGGTGNDLNSDPNDYSNVQVNAPAGITSITLAYKNIGIAGQNALLDFAIVSMLNPCVPLDTDKDGIPDYLDLDSDGDGCPDAIEGGANLAASTLVTSTLAGGNSGGTYTGTSTSPVVKNLGNTVGSTVTTLGVPTAAGIGQTIGASANGADATACLDTDGDGIIDKNDLDDDNDGILDTVECGSAVTVYLQSFETANWNVYDSSPTYQPTSSCLNGQLIGTGGANGTTNYLFHNTGGGTGCTYAIGDEVWGTKTAVPVTPNKTYQISFYLSSVGINPPQIETWINGLKVGNAVTATTWTKHTVTWNSGSATSLDLSLRNLTTSGGGNDFNIDEIRVENISCADTDNDGIANSLDLDSDGDGCSDAIEGGATFTTTNLVASTLAGGNSGAGYTGTSTTPVTQNLGNTVGNTATTMGVPTIATTGQTIGYSQAGSVNACTDTDSDGIADIDDLDDDNDGILDVIECNLQSLVVNGTFNTNLTGWTNSSGTWIFHPSGFAGNQTDGAGTYILSQSVPVTSGTLGTFSFDVAAVTRTNPVAAFFSVKLDGVTVFAEQNTDVIPTGVVTIPYLTVDNNLDIELVFRSVGGVSDDIYIDNVSFILNNCLADTDGDGIPNSKDLDSDGDGCSDAIEGGATFTNANLVASSIAGGNTGAGYTGTSTNPVIQNLGNTVGSTPTTIGVPTIATTGQTIGYSQIGSVNACKDSDNDGVADIDDLDDDNDGILDIDECAALAPYKVYTYNRIDPTLATNVPFTVTGQTSQTTVVNQTVAGTDLTYGGVSWKLLTSNVVPDATGKITVVMKPTAATTGSYAFADAVLISNGLGTNTIIDNNTTGYSQVGTWIAQTLAGNYNTTLSYVIPANYPSAAATWTFSNLPSNCDTDGDGIANSLDLDSDGDGCPDAIEGGATFTTANLVASTMAGGNSGTGYTGTSTSPVTQNLGNTVGSTPTTIGVPTIANTGQAVGSSQNGSVNACIDTDGDGIADVDDLDDDNDGILDTAEGLNCVPTILTGEFNGTFGTISSATKYRDLQNPIAAPYTYTVPTNSNAGQYAVTSKAYGQWFPAPIPALVGHTTGLDDDAYLMVNGATSVGTFYQETVNVAQNTNYTLSVWARNWTGAGSPAGDPTIALNVYDVTGTTLLGQTLISNFTLAQGWVNGTATVNVGSNAKILVKLQNVSVQSGGNDFAIDDFSVRRTDGSSLTCNSIDTDKDGIPDYLDLDSDGDGCPDAIEGGAAFTTANLQNSTIAGGNSGAGYTGMSTSPVTQNLGTTVGNTATTMGVPTIAGTGQSVGYSANGSVNACTDTDNDGIANIDDLDDDNDGILDVVECVPNNLVTNGDFSAGLTGWTNTNGTWIASGGGAANITNNAPAHSLKRTITGLNSTNTNGEIKLSLFVAANNIASTDAYLNILLGGTTYGQFRIVSGVLSFIGFNGASSDVGTVAVPLAGTNFFPNATITIPWIGKLDSGDLDFQFTANQSDFSIDNVSIQSNPVCDTDGDGIPNQLDLDSDGDGCPDAIEGGATFTLANLATSIMPGGNSGGSYNGTSTTPVTQNLGNTVGNTATTLGVPTIASTGQTIGTSQNKATQDPNCPNCPTITNSASNNVTPTPCGAATGSIKICGLTPNGTGYTVNYDKNGTPATALPNQTADASGCITITGLTAGSYTNIKISSTTCPSGSNALGATLADPTAPSSPTSLTAVPSGSVCVGTSVTLSATGTAGATYTWTVSPVGATLSSAAGTVSGTTVSNTFNSTASGTYTVSVTQTVAGCSSAPATTTITVNATPSTPVPTATSKSNVCPATTVDLTTLQPAAVSGVTYEWHTVASNPTAGDLVANPATAPSGTYYLYGKSSSGCFSAASSAVTATITICLSITQPAPQTGQTNTPKSGTVPTDVLPTGGVGTITYSNGSTDPACIAPSGATALPPASNLIIGATGAYSYTTPATPGTYYFCVKVCDSTTPTADCKIATYKVTVTAPVCAVGAAIPSLK